MSNVFSGKMESSNLYLEKAASMFQRAKYHSDMRKIQDAENRITSLKYDGACFFLSYNDLGEPKFTSRALSVKGEKIEKVDRVPHLAKVDRKSVV